MRKTFYLRHLLILTFVVAAFAAIVVYLRTPVDDSVFVIACRNLVGKTLGDAISFAGEQKRKCVPYEYPSGGFGGVDISSSDGHLISLRITPVHANFRPDKGWDLDAFKDETIVNVSTYYMRGMEEWSRTRFQF